MKKLIPFFLILITIFMANVESVLAQKITGDGNVVKETRSVSSFNKIRIDGIVNVYLTQGSTNSLTVEADQNLVRYIETPVENGTLVIKNTDDVEIKKKTKMNVYVTFDNINAISMNGVGNVEGQNQFDLVNLNVDNSGVGNLKLNLNCSKLDMDMNGVGNVSFTGSVAEARIDHNGVGNLKAFDLSADVMRIQSNGVGNAEVNSDKEIYIDVNGLGNVSYKGNAVVKELNKNGMGNIKKM